MNKNYIGGKWVAAHTGATFPCVNPATEEVLAELPNSDGVDVDRAVQAAAAAFDSWRKFPAPKRGEILFEAGRLLTERKEQLARRMTEEMGKVLAEARGDVQEAIDMTFYVAGEGRRLVGQVRPSELPNKACFVTRDPIGVVAAITPWNFPMAIPSWKLMPALVAGNSVVFKPASDTPLSACALVEILEEAGIPPGVLNLVHGSGAVAGHALATHPTISLVSFTGSTEAGRQIGMDGARDLKRVSLELGGKNAIIVLADADLDLALDGILWSAFGTSGQRCTAASRVIVEHSAEEPLLERLIPRTRQLRLGNGLEATTDVGPLINQARREAVHAYVGVGQAEGARLATGGSPWGDRGWFYQPTIFTAVRPDARIAQEEIFGPVISVIPAASIEQAVAINNHTPYGLSTSIYTRDVDKAFRALRDITTGVVYVNAGTIGAEVHLPFGGTRGTGNGHREGGDTALDVFTEWKTCYVDYSGQLQRAQMAEQPSTAGEEPMTRE
ncbi:MAG TPA: aldehyde dehydrogenase family protein [Chloroflexota bacterium]|nr:aldehyde dehydrogenase family protein [Chloroflexota bacterium]